MFKAPAYISIFKYIIVFELINIAPYNPVHLMVMVTYIKFAHYSGHIYIYLNNVKPCIFFFSIQKNMLNVIATLCNR